MIRSDALTLVLQAEGTNLGGGSANFPVIPALIARPRVTNGLAAAYARFGGAGVGNKIGQSYRGNHRFR